MTVQHEKGIGSMSRSKPVAFLLSIIVALVLIARDCFRSVWPATKPKIEARRGPIAKVFGWPPAKLDGTRETAWLDGLRGVAATLVMIYHFHISWLGMNSEAPYGAYPEWKWHIWRLPLLRLFFCAGHAQVSVFFVLSGFVLSWSTLGLIRSGRYDKVATGLGSAAFRRWFRLYLPCFVVGFPGMFLWRWGIISLVVNHQDTIWGQIQDYFLECLRWSNPFRLERSGAQTLFSYNWTMWTIPDEFAGSIWTFIICLAIAKFKSFHKRALVVFTLAAWACIQAMWTFWLFASGILIADYVREAGGFKKLSERTSRTGRIFWSFVLLLGLLMAGIPENNDLYPKPGYEWIYGWSPSNWIWVEAGVRFFWSWAGIFILLSSCHLATMRRIFELSFIRYLGRISFMLYVTHRWTEETMVYHLRQMVYHAVGHKEYNEQFKIEIFVVPYKYEFPMWIVSWIIAGPLALIVAHWFDVFVDGPCTRFSKWLDDKFTNGFLADYNNEHREEQIGLMPL